MCAASLRPVLPAVPAGQGLESGTHPLAASLTGADRAGARAVHLATLPAQYSRIERDGALQRRAPLCCLVRMP